MKEGWLQKKKSFKLWVWAPSGWRSQHVCRRKRRMGNGWVEAEREKSERKSAHCATP